MSRDSLRGFAHLGLLATLLQSFPIRAPWESLSSPLNILALYSSVISIYLLRNAMFTPKDLNIAALFVALAWLGTGPVIARELSVVEATTETQAFFDDEDGNNSDADDPAIWLNVHDPEESLVFATLKEGGLAVFDLQGKTLQRVAAPKSPGPDDRPGRFNNVDLLSGFPLKRGRKVNLAVVTDRGLDKLRIYVIDPQWRKPGHTPVMDVTSSTHSPFVFSRNQNEVNKETTAYGLAVGQSKGLREFFGFVSRRERTRIAKVRLFPITQSTVGYEVVSTLDLPKDFALPGSGLWTPCQDEDGQEPQVEGMVVDAEQRFLYSGQEQVGIWKIPVNQFSAGHAELIDSVKSYGVPYDRVFDEEEEEYSCEYRFDQDPGVAGQHLEADVEGFTIYRSDKSGGGYLIASSQGDNTFAVYRRKGDNRYLGASRSSTR